LRSSNASGRIPHSTFVVAAVVGIGTDEVDLKEVADIVELVQKEVVDTAVVVGIVEVDPMEVVYTVFVAVGIVVVVVVVGTWKKTRRRRE
jgi:hypothetical protein